MFEIAPHILAQNFNTVEVRFVGFDRTTGPSGDRCEKQLDSILAFCVCCVVRAGQWVIHLCSTCEASGSDMCVLKRASKDACGLMTTTNISIITITIACASCTNSHLRRQIHTALSLTSTSHAVLSRE